MRKHIGLHIAEGGLRSVLEAFGERCEDLVLEVRPRVSREDGGPLRIGDRVIAQAQHVELDPAGHQRDLRIHMQRDLRGGVQRDAVPHLRRLRRGDPVTQQEPAGLIGCVDLEALVGAPVGLGEPEIVEYRADVEQLPVRGEAQRRAAQRAEEEDPSGVMEDQRGGHLAEKLSRLARQR
ncbi:hypothetical protein BG28_11700 [Nesterenkonia sp. AN1]|nr:hypothetical protein BG28_11700 [Nesterenkonia sp. AN1]